MKIPSTLTIALFSVDVDQTVIFYWLTIDPHRRLTLINAVDAVNVHFYCDFHHAP